MESKYGGESVSYRRVVLPTPGGPTMVTRRGGGSSGRRSTRGTWRRFSLIWGERRGVSVGEYMEGIHRQRA